VVLKLVVLKNLPTNPDTDFMTLSSKIRRRVAVAFLLLVTAWLVSWGGAKWLIVSAPLEHADAAVLLSGSSTYFERASTAAALFNQGKVSRIILTNDNRQGGWSSAEQRNPYFFERTKRELVRQGVPESSIEVISQPVHSTYDEAQLLLAYNSTHSLTNLVVVTSPYHSRRALRTFQRMFAGTNVHIGLEHPPTGIQSPQPTSWWIKPRGWQMVPYEYVKLVYYWFRI
jgi:uncharacterized SAM-binding protein YcdF (DUF218 family)